MYGNPRRLIKRQAGGRQTEGSLFSVIIGDDVHPKSGRPIAEQLAVARTRMATVCVVRTNHWLKRKLSGDNDHLWRGILVGV